MLRTLKKHLTNIPGWRTNRKIVVFESDDWGSIRMPSKACYEGLLKSGIRVDLSKYDSLDCLEKRTDLENLLEVLTGIQTQSGSHPVFTLNTVMGNPDFEKIKQTNFQQFFFEHFFNSYKKYYGEYLEKLWKNGLENQLILPQFHAREHLNSRLWLKDLQLNHKETRLAFDHGFFGLKTRTSSPFQNHYLSAYFVESPGEFEELKKTVNEGLHIFTNSFGMHSASFTACNYTWPVELEGFLAEKGIRIIQGQRGQIVPQLNGDGKKIKRHYTGQKNKHQQVYTVRNVLFEPYLSPEKDWADLAMADISRAFFWKKPAIISTHRINYVSNMSTKNKDTGLRNLEKLLITLIKRHPEVEFMTSVQLGNLINPYK